MELIELSNLGPSPIRDLCIKYGFNPLLYPDYFGYLTACSQFIRGLILNKNWEDYSPDEDVQAEQQRMLYHELRYIWEDIFKKEGSTDDQIYTTLRNLESIDNFDVRRTDDHPVTIGQFVDWAKRLIEEHQWVAGCPIAKSDGRCNITTIFTSVRLGRRLERETGEPIESQIYVLLY